MRRLGRSMRTRLSNEQGASAVLVAILIVVLFGMGAIVLDVGNLMWERRMLQNSADAGALSAAQDYALGNDKVAEERAREFADENNPRGAHVDSYAVDPDEQTVTVIAGTAEENAEDVEEGELDTWLAPIIGADSARAAASATARWGQLGLDPETAAPFTVSLCDFFGDDYDVDDTYSPSDLDEQAESLPSLEDLNTDESPQAILFQGPEEAESAEDHDVCTISPGFDADYDDEDIGDDNGDNGEGDDGDDNGEEEGSKLPGGFGHLETEDEGCELKISRWVEGGDGEFWSPAKSGDGPGQNRECIEDTLHEAPQIPIFLGINIDEREYLLYAPASFYVTEIDIPGSRMGDTDACPGPPQSCIAGHFVQKVEGGGPLDPEAPGLGTTTIELVD